MLSGMQHLITNTVLILDFFVQYRITVFRISQNTAAQIGKVSPYLVRSSGYKGLYSSLLQVPRKSYRHKSFSEFCHVQYLKGTADP